MIYFLKQQMSNSGQLKSNFFPISFKIYHKMVYYVVKAFLNYL